MKIKNILSKITNWCKRKQLRKQLEKLVMQEASNLRNHATSEEKAKLNFYSLIPDMKSSCIYGQMTGNCNYNRSIELIEISCPRVYENNSFNIETAKLNGSPINLSRQSYWSPIEIFIIDNRIGIKVQNNKRLIEYIKGKTDKLEFI